MPIISTIVTTNTDITGPQGLLIARTGGVLTETGNAIDNTDLSGVTDGVRLIVEGTVASSGGLGVVLSGGSSSYHSVVITESGSVASTSIFNAIQIAGVGGRLFNAGSIDGNGGLSMIGDNCVVQNSGSITGILAAVTLDGGTGFSLVNSGTIAGDGTITLVNASASIQNSGLIMATIAAQPAISLLSVSALSLRNSGEIIAPGKAIQGAGQADNIRNSGTIDGDVFLGGGADVFRGKQGVLLGVLSGDAGADFLSGGKGDQLIFGGTENDSLSGDAGDDTLFGGNGYDRFVFSRRGDDDTISVFQNGTDTLDVRAFHFANFAAVAAISRDAPGGMLIDLQSVGGGTVFLDGFSKALFNATDVIL